MNESTKKTVAVVKVVSCPAERAWAIVGSGRDIDRVLPSLVRTCRVEGEGAGARRYCGTKDGTIEETIVLVDESAKVFVYRIDRQEVMPVRGYQGAMHVTDLGGGRTEILWLASFDLVDVAAEAGVCGALTALFGAGIDAIGALARGPS